MLFNATIDQVIKCHTKDPISPATLYHIAASNGKEATYVYQVALKISGNPAEAYQQESRMFTILRQCFTAESLGQYESLLLSMML